MLNSSMNTVCLDELLYSHVYKQKITILTCILPVTQSSGLADPETYYMLELLVPSNNIGKFPYLTRCTPLEVLRGPQCLRNK